MKTYKATNTYIDTLSIRCVCDNKRQRDSLFNALIYDINERNIVAMKYNTERSSKYYQITELLLGNTKLASIDRGYYANPKAIVHPDYYYININFYGLKRYNTKKDKASLYLVRTITAFLNTYHIDFQLTELDIAMDVESKMDNILAVCISRSPNVNYYQLGDTDQDKNVIQENRGTYYMENFQSLKQKKNAMSRAYLYDKREKELSKYGRDIGFEITRYEVKLQKRWFVKNEFGIMPIYKALQKYAILEFKDINQKEQLIKKLNNVKKSRQRRKLIDDAVKSNNAVLHTQKMNNVGSFLREIDTIKFNAQGEFVFTKHEDYLECMSKFNRNTK